MVWAKRLKAGEKVALKLTAKERNLLLNELPVLDDEYREIIESASASDPVMMTLDALEDFGGYVAAEANHTQDKRIGRALDRILDKISRLQDSYTQDDDQPTITMGEAAKRVAKEISKVLHGGESKIISFRLKRPAKKSTAAFPLRLTRPQREAMIHATRLRGGIKKRLQEGDEGRQVVEFSRKELEHLQQEVETAAAFAPSPYKKPLVSVLRQVSDLLNELESSPAGVKQSQRKQRPSKASDLLFQFTITLKDIKPPIWRRIQVNDCSLAELHDIIQEAMGWENYHLYQFTIEGEHYGPPEPDDFDSGLEMIDGSRVMLSQVIPKTGKPFRFRYEYDFGDGWLHEVVFENYADQEPKAKYPACLEGARACPPEDCGGPWGYVEYCEAVADRKHERHKELLEWRGPYDPEAFDAKKATIAMRRAVT